MFLRGLKSCHPKRWGIVCFPHARSLPERMAFRQVLKRIPCWRCRAQTTITPVPRVGTRWACRRTVAGSQASAWRWRSARPDGPATGAAWRRPQSCAPGPAAIQAAVGLGGLRGQGIVGLARDAQQRMVRRQQLLRHRQAHAARRAGEDVEVGSRHGEVPV